MYTTSHRQLVLRFPTAPYRQLVYCQRALGTDHPLAAKMLAVMARLHHKLGEQ